MLILGFGIFFAAMSFAWAIESSKKDGHAVAAMIISIANAMCASYELNSYISHLIK